MSSDAARTSQWQEEPPDQAGRHNLFAYVGPFSLGVYVHPDAQVTWGVSGPDPKSNNYDSGGTASPVETAQVVNHLREREASNCRVTRLDARAVARYQARGRRVVSGVEDCTDAELVPIQDLAERANMRSMIMRRVAALTAREGVGVGA